MAMVVGPVTAEGRDVPEKESVGWGAGTGVGGGRCVRAGESVLDRRGRISGQLLAILTPVAVIAVMGLGAAAWFNRISWAWAITGVAGIVLVFGAPQIVTWVRGMFGV